jgi:hypothetical protein
MMMVKVMVTKLETLKLQLVILWELNSRLLLKIYFVLVMVKKVAEVR